MKIERISENQIRCTLNKEDLEEKEILLTELAYGTDKAKSLFRDMMQQAQSELGFEVDEMPLMIEAIPVNPDCLILIITKVENPDELDTRFSRFTRPLSSNDEEDDDEDEDEDSDEGEDSELKKNGIFAGEFNIDSKGKKSNIPPGAEGLIEAIGNLAEELSSTLPKGLGANMKKSASEKKKNTSAKQLYVFDHLDDVITVSKLICEIYDNDNTLYKNPENDKFYLCMKNDKNSEIENAKIRNVLAEYGSAAMLSYAAEDYYEEHFKVIRGRDAVQMLANL